MTEENRTDTGETPAEEMAQETPAGEETQETQPDPLEGMSQEDRILHRMQSWQGRRDKEMREEWEQRERRLYNQVAQMIQPQQQPAQTYQEETPDPSVNADAWFDYRMNQREQQRHERHNIIGRKAADMLQADPLGNEIAQEIMKGGIRPDDSLPPDAAARDLVNQGKIAVLSRKVQGAPPNPLAGNRPAGGGLGSVKPPPASRRTTKQPRVEMDDMTKRLAAKMGITDEKAQKWLKDVPEE